MQERDLEGCAEEPEPALTNLSYNRPWEQFRLPAVAHTQSHCLAAWSSPQEGPRDITRSDPRRTAELLTADLTSPRLGISFCKMGSFPIGFRRA